MREKERHVFTSITYACARTCVNTSTAAYECVKALTQGTAAGPAVVHLTSAFGEVCLFSLELQKADQPRVFELSCCIACRQVAVHLETGAAPRTTTLVLETARAGGRCSGCRYYRNEAAPQVACCPPTVPLLIEEQAQLRAGLLLKLQWRLRPADSKALVFRELGPARFMQRQQQRRCCPQPLLPSQDRPF